MELEDVFILDLISWIEVINIILLWKRGEKNWFIILKCFVKYFFLNFEKNEIFIY